MYMKNKRTIRKKKKGGRTPNKTRSSKPPLAKRFFYLDALHSLKDDDLVSMYTKFESKNGPIMIESNEKSPLNFSPFFKDGIAATSFKEIKNMKINPNEKIKDEKKRDFVINAFLNELISRNLLNEDGDSI